jgi:hypothetical protein
MLAKWNPEKCKYELELEAVELGTIIFALTVVKAKDKDDRITELHKQFVALGDR